MRAAADRGAVAARAPSAKAVACISCTIINRKQYLPKATQIPLDYMVAVLQGIGVAIDRDEWECILANLIYAKYIRGHLQHELGYLIIAARDAFPAVAKVAAK